MIHFMTTFAARSLPVGFISLCGCWFAAQLSAATLSVPSQYGSIQTAITAAEPGDTIVVAPGTYRESIDFSGKAITVASRFLESRNSTDIRSTLIIPPAQSSGVTASSGETTNSRLIGFTITGCFGFNIAAVYCESGSLSILNNRILSNE